jgi:hypothetical protein
MSFQPERHYLSALLEYAEHHGSATIEEVSASTGIPTGASSGKVRPLLHYAQGMGLLDVTPQRGAYALALTPLGAAVLRDDRHLLEESTQWALHLMLCRRSAGAEAWYAVFVEASATLGRSFTEQQFNNFLINRFGSSRDPLGPLLRTCTDSAALGRTSAMVEEDGQMLLRKTPVQPALHDTVAALLFLEWDAQVPGEAQVALQDLEAASGLLAATGWSVEEQSLFFAAMERAGLVRTDRQTGSPILTRLVSTDKTLRVMYDRLV